MAAAPLIATLSAKKLQIDNRKPSACAQSGPGAPPVATASAATSGAATSPPSQPIPDLRCLNGLRVVSCLTVILFHCWMGLWQGLLPYEVTAPLTRHHWFVRLAAAGGPLGVDFFLITTAMLAAHQLIPQLEGSSAHASPHRPSAAAVVLRYWRKRAARLLPAYAAANLLVLVALGPRKGLAPEQAVARDFAFAQCPAGLWRNALFLTNWDFTQGCALHLWSLALQVQFYVLFPLLLCALRPRAPGFRARLAAALAAAFAGGTAWRLRQAFAAPALRVPYGDAVRQPSELEASGSLLTAAYFPSGTRVAELALGSALGLLLRSPAAVSWLLRRRALLAAASLGLQAAFAHTVLAWAPHALLGEAAWSPLTARLYSALLYWGSPLVTGTVAATLLALFLHSDPLHAALASALRSRLFDRLSELSYSLYLLHEQARLWAILFLVPAGLLPAVLAAAPVGGLVLLGLLTLGATLPCAYLLHSLVERRF
ncbi:hypothetical protein ABPG75_012774 [Micractinium tetrahymenae]